MHRVTAIAFVAAFALSACSGATPPTPTQQPPTTGPTATTAPVSAPPATPTQPLSTASPAPTATQVAPVGGVIQLGTDCSLDVACQDMPAGTYETSGTWAFLRGLTVTLPAGWSSGEQDAGEFMVHQASDPDQASAIFFWKDLVPWVDGAPRPELGTSADEFAGYLLGDARLTVVEGPTRTFRERGPDSLAVSNTFHARSFSVIVSASAKSDADLSDCTEACVNVSSIPITGATSEPGTEYRHPCCRLPV